MPSANASRKGQEKPREIVDAAEVGFLLPRVGERAEGGSGAIGALLRELLSALCAGHGVRCRRKPILPRISGPCVGARPELLGTATLGTVA